jgi:nicotinate-nucleotide adenylyltransferase
VGGTFNPPHRGHLELARHARRELGLERVALIPARASPHKAAEPDPGPAHRINMCRLLVQDLSGVCACGLELERPPPSYTVDTLRAIHASHPRAELTFVVGADTARTLGRWREPRQLLELARLAVAERTGSERRAVLDEVAALGGARGAAGSDREEPCDGGGPAARVVFLEMPAIEISSSQARERVAVGEPVEDLVGPAVASYIAEHGLYREGGREHDAL